MTTIQMLNEHGEVISSGVKKPDGSIVFAPATIHGYMAYMVIDGVKHKVSIGAVPCKNPDLRKLTIKHE